MPGPGPSGTRAEPAGRFRLPGLGSLRLRLVVTTVLLLAVVCTAVGVVTVVALRHFLVGRLDTQLAQTSARSQRDLGLPAYRRGDAGPADSAAVPGPGWLFAPGQPVGTLGATVTGAGVDAGVLRDARPSRSVATTTVSPGAADTLRALPVDGRYRTRTLPGLGSYRLLATTAQDGSAVIVGLPLDSVNSTSTRLAVVIAAVAGGALIIAAVAGTVLVRLNLRPLHRVAATATRVTQLPLARGDIALHERVPQRYTDPRNEVGQVGAALNKMLHHVDNALAVRAASEHRARRFLADASHELRTPLASIRGYAELTRRRQTPVPDDVAHAMHRVESEAARMTVLVEDMMLLAQLDAGRPLLAEPVDLARLSVGVVSDLRVTGPDHRWQLELPADGADTTTVVGDVTRLHQVLANLLTNARSHTPPGTTIVTRLAREGGRVSLTVTDDGPGIPPDLLPEVFTRFVRGETARTRTTGSSGLGLSIVLAVVTAHAGSVSVTSRPGHTVFTVLFPAAPAVPAVPAASLSSTPAASAAALPVAAREPAEAHPAGAGPSHS